ncbi:MAG: hypothetical protein ACRERC_12610 [Candidatus Binatia bacterium]
MPSADLCLSTYTPLWRVLAALLFAVSRAALPLLLVAAVLSTDPPVAPLALIEAVVALSLLPGLAAGLIRRAGGARASVIDGELRLERGDVQIAVPLTAIAAIEPWRLPLPEPGLTLRLRSGRRLPYGLAGDDLLAGLERLVAAGVDGARSAAAHPTIVYAAARPPRPRWYHRVGRYVLFALLPTAILFNAHQYIAYGGTLGEYRLLGLGAYLRTLGLYWGLVALHLVLFASLWRGAAEAAALAAAWVAPSRAATVRRHAETACQVLYYGGVPALLAARFLS